MTKLIEEVRCLTGVSPSLDGTKVTVLMEMDDLFRQSPEVLLQVTSIGGAPVAKGALYVNTENTTEAIPETPVEDQDARSPYGAWRYDDVLVDFSHTLTYSVYADAVAVTITVNESGRTIYSEAFYGEQAQTMLDEIQQLWRRGSDVVDFVFIAQRIKRGQDGTQG